MNGLCRRTLRILLAGGSTDGASSGAIFILGLVVLDMGDGRLQASTDVVDPPAIVAVVT